MAATENASVIAVCDAGPIIHLDELACIDLLDDFSRVIVPEAVWREVLRHRPMALESGGAKFERLPQTTPVPDELQVLSKALSLHVGETAALQIALAQDNCLLLTDDAAARLAARNLDIHAYGTLGILLRAIRRGQRTAQEIDTVLRSVSTQSTLHIKRELLDKAMREVETFRSAAEE